MIRRTAICILFCCLAWAVSAQTFNPERQYERLSRGVVAVSAPGGVFVSWRVLGTDGDKTLFNVYRDGKLLNSKPLSVSNFTDAGGTLESEYVVKVVSDGKEIEASAEVKPWADFCKTISICPPVEDNLLANASRNRPQRPGRWQPPTHKYSPSDCSVADVDGDGDYELILKWEPYNAHDNAHAGFTDPVFIDCYRIPKQPRTHRTLRMPMTQTSPENAPLWRINLGKNIRAGAHYTQFLAYDFDGDGKAEIACKTAPGTIDGKGQYVLMNGDDPNADYLGKEGRVLGRVIDGPEYLTVFSGETGEALATTEYKPGRKDIDNWGDDNFNRSERYLACVAYLDGKRPSMVFCRGYYTQSNLAAYDFDGKRLTLRWLHQSLERGKRSAFGQGAHSVAVGDVDNDGCDEIIYGSATIDHDGKCLSSTGLGHGDALHLGDLLPDRPGLEVFMVHKSAHANYCAEIHDPVTGEILWREDSRTGEDNGRGVAMDCIAESKGYEWWSLSSNNIFSANGQTGKKIGALAPGSRKPTNFRIYWDGDLLDEPYDGSTIYKPIRTSENPNIRTSEYPDTQTSVHPDVRAPETYTFQPLIQLKGSSCNGTKSTPNILADILGDWREEVILYDRDTCDKLYLYTTTTPTEHRVPTLMHDHIYRLSVAWQNVCYNQPPHLGYYLGGR